MGNRMQYQTPVIIIALLCSPFPCPACKAYASPKLGHPECFDSLSKKEKMPFSGGEQRQRNMPSVCEIHLKPTHPHSGGNGQLNDWAASRCTCGKPSKFVDRVAIAVSRVGFVLTVSINVLAFNVQAEKSASNADGSMIWRDPGRDGWRLKTFKRQEPARIAKLVKSEIAALRLYTSSTFRLINGPLRSKSEENHPLAVTTLLISNALKKLRAVHMTKTKFNTQYLWRGMKNRVVSDEFFLLGGTEMACMSTSSDLNVVASYAQSATPLLFRIKVQLSSHCVATGSGHGDAHVQLGPFSSVAETLLLQQSNQANIFPLGLLSWILVIPRSHIRHIF